MKKEKSNIVSLPAPSDSVTTETLITPAIAKEYLAKSKFNRKISPQVVRDYAEKMLQGQWRVTNQGIGFDVDDILIDGHHRLSAVVLSGVSVRMNVTLGLPKGTAALVDVGYKREPGQIMWMLYQIPDAAKVAAIGKAFLFCDGQIISLTKRVDPEKVYVAYCNNKDAFALGKELHKVGSAAMAGAIAYAYKIDPAKSTEFVTRIVSKVGIEHDSPEQAFLQWVESTSKRGGNGGMVRQRDVIWGICAALVHKYKGEKLKIVRPTEGALEVIRKMRKDAK